MTAASAPIARRRPRGRPLLLGAVALTAAAVLAGCGANSAESGSTASSYQGNQNAGPAQREALAGAGSAAQADKGAAPAATPAGTAGSAGKPGSDPGPTVKARLIRTAQVTVEVNAPLSTAAALVRTAAVEAGGHVDSETTGYTDTAEQKAAAANGSGQVVQAGESLIVLRIPESKLDDVTRKLTDALKDSKGGKVVSQTSSTQDVTGDIADLTSRVASKRASLDRVRALMAKATSLQDVVALESELANRESDLEALESRLATLSDQADLSTLTVLLRTAAASPAPKESENGFLAGLKAGWRALVGSTTVVLTVLGALLPIGVVVLVIGYPVLRVLRRRQARAGGTPPTSGWPFTPGRPGPGSGGPGSGGPGSGGPGSGGPGSGGPGPDGPDDGAPDGSDQPQPVGAGSPSGS